jgi:hypothetical protein
MIGVGLSFHREEKKVEDRWFHIEGMTQPSSSVKDHTKAEERN